MMYILFLAFPIKISNKKKKTSSSSLINHLIPMSHTNTHKQTNKHTALSRNLSFAKSQIDDHLQRAKNHNTTQRKQNIHKNNRKQHFESFPWLFLFKTHKVHLPSDSRHIVPHKSLDSTSLIDSNVVLYKVTIHPRFPSSSFGHSSS